MRQRTERRIIRKEETEAYHEQGASKYNCSKKKIYTGEKDKTYKEYYIQKEKAGNSNDNSRKKKTPSKVTNQESQFEIEYETK